MGCHVASAKQEEAIFLYVEDAGLAKQAEEVAPSSGHSHLVRWQKPPPVTAGDRRGGWDDSCLGICGCSYHLCVPMVAAKRQLKNWHVLLSWLLRFTKVLTLRTESSSFVLEICLPWGFVYMFPQKSNTTGSGGICSESTDRLGKTIILVVLLSLMETLSICISSDPLFFLSEMSYTLLCNSSSQCFTTFWWYCA